MSSIRANDDEKRRVSCAARRVLGKMVLVTFAETKVTRGVGTESPHINRRVSDKKKFILDSRLPRTASRFIRTTPTRLARSGHSRE